ncbi:ABC transporter ATP-binding protein [Corynebacterium sp. H128]|uniref:ABC transporter ATP-binding protein n=1 Tax=Corynebacterium sp. H128 TaxID=3133427 RepID=UPI00309EB2E7
MNAPDIALSLRNVRKTFGSTVAVADLSFDVPAASVLALLGPNGAGKTTTIEICEGFQTPSSGEIRVLGLNPVTHTDEVRRRIGIMLQGGGAYPGIRVAEMMRLVASYSARPLDPDWLLELVGLGEHRRTAYRRLSGGQQQRLSLALALVGRPELVFLDEPTAGMDAQSRLLVWDLIAQLRADGVAVVLTTHLMDEAEALADQVVIVDRGSVVASGSPAQLMRARAEQLSSVHLETMASLDVPAMEAALRVAGATGTLTPIRPQAYHLEIPATPELLAVVTAEAARQGVLIRNLGVDATSLEEVFLDVTGREMRS